MTIFYDLEISFIFIMNVIKSPNLKNSFVNDATYAAISNYDDELKPPATCDLRLKGGGPLAHFR